MIIIDGDLNKPCEIQKSMRLGCPISPLLLILMLEILTRDIRHEKITSIKIKNGSLLIEGFCWWVSYISMRPQN